MQAFVEVTFMYDVTFSIIVVSLNAEKTIETTLNSILEQTCTDYEVVIKDGKSKDNTLGMIPKDERIRIYSEADRSVYDAMNQALNYTKGKFIIFMNCGDTFYSPHVLERFQKIIQEQALRGNELLYGNYAKGGKESTQCSLIDERYLIKSGLCHQTVFFGKEVFDKIGGFDDTMLICADYEIMVRAFFAENPYIYVNEVVCNYLGGGLSEMEKNIPLVKKEGNIVRRRYFSSAKRCQYIFDRILKRLKKSRML